MNRVFAIVAGTLLGLSVARPQGNVLVLYDSFGKPSALKEDWGFSALVEAGGKRILFDAGNDSAIFAANASAAHADLTKLDFVVISHRHGDHTKGLDYLIRVNPGVRIYVPADEYFLGVTPRVFFSRPVSSLPSEMRYFGGAVPETVGHGNHWPGANFVMVDSVAEVAPGFTIVPTVSHSPGTMELQELSLSISTPGGQVLIVGCSHAGIEEIVRASEKAAGRTHMVMGGLHLVTAPDDVIRGIARSLHTALGVEWIAPVHCSGERAFAAFKKEYEDHYLFAGLGSRVALP